MRWLVLLLGFASASALGQIYRWTDAQGRTHFSNVAPPQGVKATIIDPNAKEGPPAAESGECYTVRCQGERMEERIRRRDEADARVAAERAADAPKPVRGLEFRKYIGIQRGMSEGELLGVAGEPDFIADQGTTPVSRRGRGGFEVRTWTYLPTSADPFTTTVTLVGGRVGEVERVRKF